MSVLGEVAYLLEGESGAVLIDAMGGLGDLPAVIQNLIGEKSFDVLLTHRHQDHTGGSYWFDEVFMHEEEANNYFEMCELCAPLVVEFAEKKKGISPDVPYSVRDKDRPSVNFIDDGDTFDLGGKTIEVVSLPGHTDHSLGFICPELRCLFAGDAVTPIAVLCFPESLSIEDHQATIKKIGELPIDSIYTGHHDHTFTKDDLPSFYDAAEFAKSDRGFSWWHTYIPGWEGTMHLCPCETRDVDSVDFRAVITKGFPPKKSKKKA